MEESRCMMQMQLSVEQMRRGAGINAYLEEICSRISYKNIR